MQKTLLALSSLVVVTFIASAAGRTQASPLANPSALSGAIDAIAVVDNVHCRPGSAHHTPTRWRRASGCLRDSAGVVELPRPTWNAGPDGAMYGGYYYPYYPHRDFQDRGLTDGD
jgi:hypothetical protein